LIDIDRDSFDDVLSSCSARVSLAHVSNTLSGGSGNLTGAIEFKKFSDFEPMAVVDAVQPLKDIYAKRGRLRAFQAKSEASDALSKLVESSVSHEHDPVNPAVIPGDALRTELLAAFADNGLDSWANVGDTGTITKMLDAMIRGDDRTNADKVKAAKMMIGQFVQDIIRTLPADNKLVSGKLMDQCVSEIDKAMGIQLDAVLHSSGFQRLEAAWRGLHYLVFRAETGKSLKLRVMNISKDELRKEMEKAPEFDQSHIFKLIYEAEFGTYGGNPYSLLVGDYAFGRSGPDQALLGMMSQIAAAAHAPFIACADAPLLDLSTFEDLARPRDLSKIFESQEVAEWTAFRDSEDSRYVTLALPRVLLRTPYGEKTQPVDGISYEENVDMDAGAVVTSDPKSIADQAAADAKAAAEKAATAKTNAETAAAAADAKAAADEAAATAETAAKKAADAKIAADQAVPTVPVPKPKDSGKFLWGNPAYVLAERITNAFSLYAWTAAIRGVKGGGLIEGLPVYTYGTAEGDVTMTCPTQVTITDRREKELNDLGFMAICHCKGTNKAAFFGGQTTNSPKKYFSANANANAKLSAMLPYMLAASRFAHYLKVIMRERIGTFMTRANVESFLNDWISNYVLLDDSAPQEIKATYPLRAAQVTVTDDPANPGSYKATVFLKPHFQLEELSTSIRLVAQLPS